MADQVTTYCFQRTGTLAFAPAGENQKSNPELTKKSSPVTNKGWTCSIKRVRVGDAIHSRRCASVESNDDRVRLAQPGNGSNDVPVQMTGRRLAQRRNLFEPSFIVRMSVA